MRTISKTSYGFHAYWKVRYRHCTVASFNQSITPPLQPWRSQHQNSSATQKLTGSTLTSLFQQSWCKGDAETTRASVTTTKEQSEWMRQRRLMLLSFLCEVSSKSFAVYSTYQSHVEMYMRFFPGVIHTFLCRNSCRNFSRDLIIHFYVEIHVRIFLLWSTYILYTIILKIHIHTQMYIWSAVWCQRSQWHRKKLFSYVKACNDFTLKI